MIKVSVPNKNTATSADLSLHAACLETGISPEKSNLLHIHSLSKLFSKADVGEGQSEWRKGERWPTNFT